MTLNKFHNVYILVIFSISTKQLAISNAPHLKITFHSPPPPLSFLLSLISMLLFEHEFKQLSLKLTTATIFMFSKSIKCVFFLLQHFKMCKVIITKWQQLMQMSITMATTQSFFFRVDLVTLSLNRRFA